MYTELVERRGNLNTLSNTALECGILLQKKHTMIYSYFNDWGLEKRRICEWFKVALHVLTSSV